MTGIIRAPNLIALSNVRHGFFTRRADDGANIYDAPDGVVTNSVMENRRRVAAHFELSAARLLTCRQVHKTGVITVNSEWSLEASPEADALVTNVRGLALGVLTADCVPVLLADGFAGVIGAAHAGWKGAFEGVLDNALMAMEKLGAMRSNIVAALGPCIWQDSYEVDRKFYDRFMEQDPANEIFFKPSPVNAGHYMFDLPGYVMGRLNALGVHDISPSPADTSPDEARFISYRRCCLKGAVRIGNQISVIVLA